MRNYCIKIYLEDGTYGYYSGVYNGAPQFTTDANQARLYDTGDDALDAFNKVFGRYSWSIGGVKIVRNSVVAVNVYD